MARKIDENKINSIKESTMKMIVDHGIEATTIAMIAKNAKVSGGYLYRIYSGKQDLINALFFEKVHSLLNELEFLLALNPTTIEPIISAFTRNRLVYNDNFTLSEDLKVKNIHLMEAIKQIGVQSGEVSSTIHLHELHYHILIYPVDYIHFKRKNIFDLQESTMDDVTYLTNNILKLLKK